MPETAATLGLGFDNLGEMRIAVCTVGKHAVLEGSEAQRKVIVLPRRQVLVAQENYPVIEKRLVDLFQLLIEEPRRQIKAVNFGADSARLRYDFHDAV